MKDLSARMQTKKLNIKKQLMQAVFLCFARVVGIEPTVQVLETCGLPLTDTRSYFFIRHFSKHC